MRRVFGKTEYRVLRRLKSMKYFEIYLAQSDWEPVILMAFSDVETAKEAERFFKQAGMLGFRDLLEVFSRKDTLLAALRFVPADALPLAKVCKELGLKERNRLAASLMEEIRAGSVPWPVLRDVLRPGRVFASSGGGVSFLYLLEFHGGYERDCRAEVMCLLAETLGGIYGDADYPVISVFLDELRAERFTSLDGVYIAFRRVYTAVESMPVIPPPDFGLKDKLLALIGRLRDVVLPRLAAIIVVALLIFGYVKLGQALYNAIVNVPITGNLAAIGTVELYEETE